MEILYKDEHIVVCIKPSGVLSAMDISGSKNMTDMLKEELGVDQVYPVHRLDREVSGVMVYALNQSAAAKLSADSSDKDRFKKVYYAVCSGIPAEQTVKKIVNSGPQKMRGESIILPSTRKVSPRMRYIPPQNGRRLRRLRWR